MTGNVEDVYVARETPMIFYLNVHTALEQMRIGAETSGQMGPRVLIVGPDDVGKSTLSRMLLNWAVRVGRLPILVDLDVSQNCVSLPGTISALVVERTALVEEASFNIDAQIAYHFGYKTPAENPVLYRRLISVLKDTINFRSEYIQASLVSGCVINMSGWVKDEGYKSILHTAQEFEVSTILVLDQERLRVELKRDLPDVKVLSLPKSGGVVCKSNDARAQAKSLRIHEYFYGCPRSCLYPHSIEIGFGEVKIFKIGAPQLPDSLLPMGMKAEDNNTKIFQIQPCNKV